jgi:hypothetical protein
MSTEGPRPTAVELPDGVATVADELAASRGVVAVVLGGSRATGDARPESDWDLGVYYRGDLDLTAVAARGEVFPPGSWGRLMNGGAWLEVDGTRVDVLLRDLDVVEHWTKEAEGGRYEVDGLLGYVAGIPTYSLAAEAAAAVTIRGSFAGRTAFPDALAEAAPARWRYCRDFSLMYAERHAGRGNTAGTVGQAARAVLEEAHARACEARRWVLNEKHVVAGVGLEGALALLGGAGHSVAEQVASVAARRAALASPPCSTLG